MEIERKFLVAAPPSGYEAFPFHQIEQAYLCTGPVVRIRREDQSYYLTYKSSGALSREEYNLPYELVLTDLGDTFEENRERITRLVDEFEEKYHSEMEDLFSKLTESDEHGEKILSEYTDYREYMDYDIEILTYCFPPYS